MTLSDVTGTVLAVHPTSIELTDADGNTVLVPWSRLVQETMTVVRVER